LNGSPKHSGEVTLVEESKLRGQLRKTLMALGDPVDRDRYSDIVSVLGERRASDAAEDAADVERRVTQLRSEPAQVERGWICRDRLTHVVHDPLVGSRRHSPMTGQPAGRISLDQAADKPRQASVELPLVDAGS
jgi:hypothetical protein